MGQRRRRHHGGDGHLGLVDLLTGERIVARALAPGEGRPGLADAAAREAAAALVARWEERLRLAEGGALVFEERLAALGLDRTSAVEWLLPRELVPGEPLPAWALVLEQALEPGASACADLAGEGPTARPSFPEVLHPFVTVALRALDASPGAVELTEGARRSIARSLLARLSRAAARTLAFEVKAASRAGALAGDTPTARYASFVDGTVAPPDGLAALLERYPVLGRILATLTHQASDSAGELLARLFADREALAATLHDARPLGRLTGLELHLSDAHGGGRAVARLAFESGATAIYKPRDLSVDAAFAAFVAELEPEPLRAPRVLAREGYGWCEDMRIENARDSDGVVRFFRRQGALAAVLHFLCGRDFHHENVVASGEHPVPVDLEGVLSPDEHDEPLGARLPPWARPGAPTPTATLLAPLWVAGDEDLPCLPISGILGVPADRAVPLRRPEWVGLGTDELALARTIRPEPADGCLPRLAGEPVRVGPQHVAAVEAGFEAFARALVARRDALLAPSGPLERFRETRARCIVRSSQVYGHILDWSTSPDLLVSGAAHDVALEMLAVRPARPGFAIVDLVDEEKRALRECDVPCFRGQPALARARERISGADEAEIAWGKAVLGSSLRMALEPAAARPARPEESTTRLLGAARRLGEALERLALRGSWGAAWLDLHRGPGEARYGVSGTLARGSAGTAVFLAHLARATGEERFATLAREGLEHAERTAREHAAFGNVSAFEGVLSPVPALLESARILEEPALVARALAFARELRGELFRGVTNPDFLGGAAGTLAALVELERAAPRSGLIAVARELAAVVLAAQEPGEGPAGYFAYPPRARLGLAHGACGVALALARLWKTTGEEIYIESVRRALAHERAHFDGEAGGWPNLAAAPGEFASGLCAGAAGIGLARVGLLETLGAEEAPALAGELEQAVAATRPHLRTDDGGQHLCCGEAGRIVFMVHAARWRGDGAWLERARDGALALVDSWESAGDLVLHEGRERAILPSFLSGIAGVGLALLAPLDPESATRLPILGGVP